MFTLEAEERCGHLVTEETKQLWAVELDILEEFKRICKKHNLTYFAIGGTLLGAVRHKGYIPWDDDIDVGMLSEDYVRFCEIAKEELAHPYCFQHFSTQEGFGLGYSRIRNSNTTACTKWEYRARAFSEQYNCGVFIDLFPLHTVPDDERDWKKQKKHARKYEIALAGFDTGRGPRPHGIHEMLFCLRNVLMWRFMRIFMNYHQIAQKAFDILDRCRSGSRVRLASFWAFSERLTWKKEDFSDIVELPFENTTIACPVGYDNILKHQYGNYMVFEKGSALHSFAVLDPSTPYKDKMKEHYAEFKK